jgi:hypothetical protein
MLHVEHRAAPRSGAAFLLFRNGKGRKLVAARTEFAKMQNDPSGITFEGQPLLSFLRKQESMQKMDSGSSPE